MKIKIFNFFCKIKPRPFICTRFHWNPLTSVISIDFRSSSKIRFSIFWVSFSLRKSLRKWGKNPKFENLKFSKAYISRSIYTIPIKRLTFFWQWMLDQVSIKKFLKKLCLRPVWNLKHSSFLVFFDIFDISENLDLGYVQIATKQWKIDENQKFKKILKN